MADERIITLRFKGENHLDMELCQSLKREKKELGLSMPAYVKEILRQHFENIRKEGMDGELNRCLEQMQNIVQEELAALKEMVAEAMAGMSEFSPKNPKTDYEGISMEKEEILPEYSEELPKDMESVLEQFM